MIHDPTTVLLALDLWCGPCAPAVFLKTECGSKLAGTQTKAGGLRRQGEMDELYTAKGLKRG